MDEASIGRILESQGLPFSGAVRSGHEGIVCEVWLSGPFVVRVLKDRDYESDLRTEAMAGPAAFWAGVLTPEFLSICLEDGPLGPPHSILRRAPGAPLAVAGAPDPEALFHALAREIRICHDRVTGPFDREDWLNDPWTVDLAELEQRSSRGGLDGRPSALAGLLAEAGGAWKPVLAHQDLHSRNILASEGKLSAILDWGDAGWGDPACDLRYAPFFCMEAAWDGYGPDPDPGFRARCCLHMVDQFVYRAAEGDDFDPLFPVAWDSLEAFCRQAVS